MWTYPWRYKEGFAIGGGLIVTGLLLQFCTGGIVWEAFAFPVNLIALFVFLSIALCIYIGRRKSAVCRFLSTTASAIPAMTYAATLTVIMGLTPQIINGTIPFLSSLGITQMLRFQPFVLIYIWVALTVSQICLQRLHHFKFRNIPSLLCHGGLLVVLLAATLGYPDIRKLKMTITKDRPEWRAIDDKERVTELPLAIQLKNFTIEEYPPKLILVNINTGQAVPSGKPETLLLDSMELNGRHSQFSGLMGKWNVVVLKFIENAAPEMRSDTTNYVEWPFTGAENAALVEVSGTSKAKIRDWITGGSYLFPPQSIPVDDSTSLVLPAREPRRYTSDIEVMTKRGKHIETVVEVNKPFHIEGWNIYQLSYNENMGRWSDTSTLELVSDPWLPAVYIGIFMILAGTVCMFILTKCRKEEKQQ